MAPGGSGSASHRPPPVDSVPAVVALVSVSIVDEVVSTDVSAPPVVASLVALVPVSDAELELELEFEFELDADTVSDADIDAEPVDPLPVPLASAPSSDEPLSSDPQPTASNGRRKQRVAAWQRGIRPSSVPNLKRR